MQFLKKYWPTIMSVAGGVVTFAMPSLVAYVSTHPKTAVGVLLSAVIAAYHSSSPADQTRLAR